MATIKVWKTVQINLDFLLCYMQMIRITKVGGQTGLTEITDIY